MSNREWYDWHTNSQPKTSRPQPRAAYTYNTPPPYKPLDPAEKLRSFEIQIERKNYFLTLSENSRGRFLRVVEDGGKRRNAIVIPSTGLAEFQKLLEQMLAASDAIPAKPVPPAE